MIDWLRRLALPAFGTVLGLFAGAASPCEQAALDAEKAFDLPAGLMAAIGRIESGRYDSDLGRVVAWPWTIDVAGEGRQYDTATEVVSMTKWLRDNGVRNIDVGCFQISLQYHPDAFATLEEAFDPAANGRYAGQLLASLKTRLGTWPDAVAAYHSADPARGGPYRDKVYASLQGTPLPVTEVDLTPPGPRQLAFGIQLWTPSRTGAAASVIHIGSGTAPPLPTVTHGPGGSSVSLTRN